MGLAARGARNMDNGVEVIEDAAVLARVRRQARSVYLKAILAGLVLTALFLLLP